jgi:hypothetical protein
MIAAPGTGTASTASGPIFRQTKGSSLLSPGDRPMMEVKNWKESTHTWGQDAPNPFRRPVMAKSKPKVTGAEAAASASKTLKSPKTAKASKTAAASALSQAKEPARTTSETAAAAASKTLRDGRTSKASKSAAGSALSQAPAKKKK